MVNDSSSTHREQIDVSELLLAEQAKHRRSVRVAWITGAALVTGAVAGAITGGVFDVGSSGSAAHNGTGAAGSPSRPGAHPTPTSSAQAGPPGGPSQNAPLGAVSSTAKPEVMSKAAPKMARHVVRSGESLWSITQDTLGSRSTNALVRATWPQLWKANHATIGEDPNIIQPGQVLQIPKLA